MKNIIFLLLTMLLLADCHKDSENTRKDFLTAADCWHVVKIEFYDSTTLMWDDFFLDDCLIENCWRYFENGRVTWDNGAQKCSADEPDFAEGTWVLSSDWKNLTISFGGLGEETAEIVGINSKQMVIEEPVDDFDPYTKRRSTYERL